jgi:chromosome segregation ATPase
MKNGFVQIGGSQAGMGGENSFWPAFTDVMMVITLIFLMATSILVVRNWQLVAELQESVAAERVAVQIIESTSLENATLEERLANAEQTNSILRLRIMKKDELLAQAQVTIGAQELNLITLEQQNSELQSSLQLTQTELGIAKFNVSKSTASVTEMTQQIAQLNQQLAQQQQANDDTRLLLGNARLKINELSEASRQQQQTITRLSELKNQQQLTVSQLSELKSEQQQTISQLSELKSQQQQSINQLSAEKSQLSQASVNYNRQLQTLKSDYDLVKLQYEELIKPARSAKGKHIVQVYYIKDGTGVKIRYRQPSDEDFSRLTLVEVEKRLDILKRKYGDELYIKIIIPEDSGLSYNEAWEFMRKLLAKYDYYYQE